MTRCSPGALELVRNYASALQNHPGTPRHTSTLDILLDYIGEHERDRADALRWRHLVAAVEENQRRAYLGGGVILSMMPRNEHDAAWASIQALDHNNPRGAVWTVTAEDLDGAADALAAVARTCDCCGRTYVGRRGARCPNPYVNNGCDGTLEKPA